MCKRSGWTLLELLVVMALLAIVTAGAAFTVHAPLRAGRVRSQIDAILTADRTARSHARRFQQPAQLNFEWTTTPTLTVKSPGGASSRFVAHLDALLRVRQMAASQAAGEATIVIDPVGRSATYAVCFADPAGENIWLVVAGETGQPILDLTEQEIHDLSNVLGAPASGP